MARLAIRQCNVEQELAVEVCHTVDLDTQSALWQRDCEDLEAQRRVGIAIKLAVIGGATRGLERTMAAVAPSIVYPKLGSDLPVVVLTHLEVVSFLQSPYILLHFSCWPHGFLS